MSTLPHHLPQVDVRQVSDLPPFTEHWHEQMGLFDWFKKRSGKGNKIAPRTVGAAGKVKSPKKKATPQENSPSVSYTGNVGGQIADGGPGKNILVKNRYVREDTGTHETLKIIDDSILDDEAESGADPYNTGRFDRSKSWNSARWKK